MSSIPGDLKYTKSHEWVRRGADGTLTMGITDHAQELMGEIVMVELPPQGGDLRAGDSTGVLEAVKTAEDFFAPVDGKVAEANAALESDPGLVNRDCYGEGWLIRIRPADASQFDALLTPAQYGEIAGE
ncbi:MAG TPA: glycine cleavage system protein GcvH [Candidatus Fermentibacter sp.]|nr:glycine cleavage system protein GcvH [Candidatus Fermentibacter sp.]